MAAVLDMQCNATAERPIVIVGSGPVGVRVAQELDRRDPTCRAILYGAEPQLPYNRVHLSALLAGEIEWSAVTGEIFLPKDRAIEPRFGCAVRSIDRDKRFIVDAQGCMQPYSQLVLAMGSRPSMPTVENLDLPGVYTFRDLDDAQRLFARRMRSRRTVVLGGGLLGLEAARAMRRFHTEVTVIEHALRLMPRQLDDDASELLRSHLERLAIRIVLGEGVRRVLGDGRPSGVELMSGARIECDTVIVATGIRPNIDIARRAGLAVGRGIRVDDTMRTSDAAIFAVGECAEHRGTVYGLLAPGLEQAAVVAAQLAGMPARYRGSTSATRLKVVGLPVFSIGRVADDDLSHSARHWMHRGSAGGYCKVVTEYGQVVGAVALGEHPEIGRLQEAVTHHRRFWPWQLHRFTRIGRLWRDLEPTSVVHWPANVTVCNCTGVTRGQLGAAFSAGCRSVESLAGSTGASTVCGSCRPLLTQLCGAAGAIAPVRGSTVLLWIAGFAALASILFALPLSVRYAQSVQDAWQWDFLWRTSAWKQASGFSVLGLSVAALLMSLRKRFRRFTAGDFSIWRIVHGMLGALTLAALLVHTGGRTGANLNFLLMACFLGLLVLGGAASAVVALEHRIGVDAVRLRGRWVWAHILVFWPVPVLLGVHIYKSYHF